MAESDPDTYAHFWRDRAAALEAENARLRAIISGRVESFGTPELVAWADKLQRILSAYPEEERGNWPFVLDMGAHLQKFVKSWNDPEITAKDARIAELEAALRDLLDGIAVARPCDWITFEQEIIAACAVVGIEDWTAYRRETAAPEEAEHGKG